MSAPEYVRNSRGTIVHLRGCSRVGPFPPPLMWAVGLEAAEIEKRALQTMRPCAFCKPFGGDAE